MPHNKEAGVVPSLLVALCVATVLPTLATGSTSETIDSNKYVMKELQAPSTAICLLPLEGGPDVEAKLRLEVVPIDVGSENVHLAGNVDVPKELLQQESGTFLLRYEFTTIDKKVALNVTLNNKELPYTPFQDMYIGRYEFHLVKFYIRGRVKVIYDCTHLPTTTTTLTPTPTPTGGVWALGAVGNMPALIVTVIGIAVLVVLAVVLVFILKHRKNGRRTDDENQVHNSHTSNGNNMEFKEALITGVKGTKKP